MHVSRADRHIKGKHRLPKWKTILVGLGILLALGIVGYILAKPVYHRFRSWKIDQNGVAAQKALAEGRYDDARRLALSVVRMKKGRYDMFKVLRVSMEKLDDPRAVGIARTLMVLPGHTREDRIDGFEMTCAKLPMALVFGTWGALTEEERKDPAFIAPLEERLIDQRLIGDAQKLLTFSSDIDQHPELLFQRARLNIASEDSEKLDNAQFDIAAVMRMGGAQALPAFRLLDKVPWDKFHSAYFPELGKWLSTQKDATVSDRLIALIQEFRRFPQRSVAITNEAVEKYGADHPVEIAEWLTKIGHPERALHLLPDDPKSADVEAFRARAEALAALEHWQELFDWLANDPPLGFPSLELHVRRVIAAKHTGATATQTQEWEDAFRNAAAKTNENGFLEINKRMIDAGLFDLAREAMVSAIRLNRGRLPVFYQVRGLAPWLRDHRRGLALREFARVMAGLEPNNPNPVAVALHLGCVSGSIDPSVTVAELTKLIEAHPEIPGLDEALATALLLDNQPDKALAQLPPDATTRPGHTPHALAITGVAMAMKGEDEKASKILKRVEWNKMLTEECDAFSRALSNTRLGKSDEQEKIQKFAEAAAPPPDEQIFQELMKKEEERKKRLKEFEEKHR
jgi:hypothetical protein